MKWWDSCHDLRFLKAKFKVSLSLSSFTFIKRVFRCSPFLPLEWCHLNTEAVDISLSNLDSSLWFIQLSISHDVLCKKVKWARWQYIALCTPFPTGNQSVVPCLILSAAPCPAYRFLRIQVRWSGIPIPWRIFHSLLWSTQSESSV